MKSLSILTILLALSVTACSHKRHHGDHHAKKSCCSKEKCDKKESCDKKDKKCADGSCDKKDAKKVEKKKQ